MDMDNENPEQTRDDLFLGTHEVEVANPLSDALSQFECAQDALYRVVSDIMHGKGESVEELQEHLSLLTIASGRSFAEVAVMLVDEAVDNSDEAATQIVQLFIVSRKVRCEIFEHFGTDAEFLDTNIDSLASTVVSILAQNESLDTEEIDGVDDSDDPRLDMEKALEVVFGDSCQGDINALLDFAPLNQKEIMRNLNDQRIAKFMGILADTAKIAVGATVAVVITQILQQRKNQK